MTTHMSEPESPCRSLTWRDVLIPTRQSSSSSELVVDWVNRMQRPRCPDTREYAEPILYWSAVVKLELNMSNYTWYIGLFSQGQDSISKDNSGSKRGDSTPYKLSNVFHFVFTCTEMRCCITTTSTTWQDSTCVVHDRSSLKKWIVTRHVARNIRRINVNSKGSREGATWK